MTQIMPSSNLGKNLVAQRTGRRKRPHVPQESRKRIARACNACRRLKEKCEGGSPCMRCTRLQRECVFAQSPQTSQSRSSLHDQSSSEEFYDPERIKAMEKIVTHYTSNNVLSKSKIIDLAQSLQDQPRDLFGEQVVDVPSNASNSSNNDDEYTINPLSSTTAVYAGELSHNQFSIHVQRRLHDDLSEAKSGLDACSVAQGTERASRLHSNQSVVTAAAAAIPPIEVTNFLIAIFFEYAQTNYSYVDIQSLQQRIDKFFAHGQNLTSNDAAWVCTLLMLLAVGTQFAHLSAKESHDAKFVEANDNWSPDDVAGLNFYHAAITLIPDVIALASIESVQAFLVLGVYTLPVDASGLSFIYLGIAVKIAIQNGMHRKFHRGMDSRTVELRNRIWWTAYTLEKRICVLHGRPVSIPKAEVDAAQPSCLPALDIEGRIDSLPNILAMIKLTGYLEDARDKMSCLRKSSKSSKASILASVLQLEQELDTYWHSLPEITYCRDLTPKNSLFRFNTHLALTYHLTRIFIGRGFILTSQQSNVSDVTPDVSLLNGHDTVGTLVSCCIESAVAIVHLCQKMEDQTGLARASYTEFTSCRAALLVILAQRIHERNLCLKKICEQGFELLKHMSLGFYSASAEKAAIEAMETALQRLDNSKQSILKESDASSNVSQSAYDQFRNWAMLWKNDTPPMAESSALPAASQQTESYTTLEPSSFSSLSPFQSLGWDINSPSFSFEIGDFTFDSGLE